MKYDTIIGIDPDSIKSGVAVVGVKHKVAHCASVMTFSEIVDYLQIAKEAFGDSAIVVVEAGWLNLNNWHLTMHDTLRTASAKGKMLGRCEQTGRLILEMAEHIGLDCVARKPLQKCWRGRDRKITHDEIKEITGITTRTNQESRDALLLAWVEAGLPLFIKPKKK